MDETEKTISQEYEKILDLSPGERTSEVADESLNRVERSISKLRGRIKKEVYDLSDATRDGIKRFGDELDELRSSVEKQREKMREKDLYKKSEVILMDIRNNYNMMVERYLKW